MSAPSKKAVEFQRQMMSVDNATMKLAKMIMDIQTLESLVQEKERTIHLHQEKIMRIENDNSALRKKLEELQNQTSNIPLKVETLSKPVAVSPKKTAAAMSPLTFDRGHAPAAMTPPLSAGFVVPSPSSGAQSAARKSGVAKFIPFFSFSKPVKSRKIVFSLVGPLAKNDSVPFVKPENYLQMAPSRDFYSTLPAQKRKSETSESEIEEIDTDTPTRQTKRGRKMQTGKDKKRRKKEEAAIEKQKSPRKRKTTKIANVDNDVSDETTPTKHVDKKSKEGRQHQADSNKMKPQNSELASKITNVQNVENFEIETPTKDAILISTTRGETENSPTTECLTSNEKTSQISVGSKRRLSGHVTRVSKFAVSDYIPLGVAHSTLATPTERIATSVRESKIMLDKKKTSVIEADQNSASHPSQQTSAFRRAQQQSTKSSTKPILSNFVKSGTLHPRVGVPITIAPKQLPKTTFARPLPRRLTPKNEATLAIKVNKVEKSCLATSPSQLSSVSNDTTAAAELSISQDVSQHLLSTVPCQSLSTQIATTDVLPQPKSATPLPKEKTMLQLPDISKPPPNFDISENLVEVQLPDLTQLPPLVSKWSHNEEHDRAKDVPTAISPQNSGNNQVEHLKAEAGDSPANPVKPNLTDLSANTTLPAGDLTIERTFLEDMMESYLADRDIKESALQAKRNQNEIDPYQFEIMVNLIKSQLGRLWRQTSEADLKSIVGVIVKSPSNVLHIRRHLTVQCIYQEVREEYTWETVCTDPNLVPLTVKQTKLVTLLCMLEEEENFRGIIDEFLIFVRYNLLGKERLFHYKRYQLANLSRIYIALCRLKGDETTARLFLYDILFLKNSRTHVIISVFLDTWYQILQKPKTAGQLDPLSETIIWLIYNTGPATSKAQMKVYEAQNKLLENCGFERHPFTGPKFVLYLISVAESHMNVETIRNATTKSLLLMARWQDYRWTNNNIVTPLLNVMKKNMLRPATDTLKAECLAWVIDSIGHVSKFYPSTTRDHLLGIYNPLPLLLQNKETLTAKLEKVCIRSLLWIGTHLQAQNAKFFTEWKPKFPFDSETASIVKDYIGTRGFTFAQNLITGIKKRRVHSAVMKVQAKNMDIL